MITVKVCEYLNTKHLLSPEKGEKLRLKIEELIARNVVILDFQGYEYVSSSFLNEALSKILIKNSWSVENFKQHILFNHVEEDDLVDFELALENAKNKLSLMQRKIDPEEFYRTNLPAC